LGVLTDETGVPPTLPPEASNESPVSAFEDFGGKVAGAPIKIVHADHQNKTDVGSTMMTSTPLSTSPTPRC
jgi:branched-chain amino acid transport system substrate-binding protein